MVGVKIIGLQKEFKFVSLLLQKGTGLYFCNTSATVGVNIREYGALFRPFSPDGGKQISESS
jgi:hypothetical protein